jgi:uncharacterized repeat protein (TIGR01451 family)
MKTTKQMLGAVSALALIAMTSAPALAEGTSAGTTISNTVNVTYEVGGIVQNAETATDNFTVDRRVNVNVEYIGPATSVSPGQQDAVIAFDVTNLSNSIVDLDLAAALTAGTGANIANFQFYLDDGDNVFDAGDTLVTFLDEVGEDQTRRVFVIADIGLNAANGDEFDVTLTANAHAGATAGSLGAELVATSGANTAGIDTVLFDGQGATDAERDGAFSDTGTYEVAGADVTVTKSSRVVSDPVNLTNNPKAIPGATVEYCIRVANAAGAATATDVNVTDNLPSDVTFVDDSIRINGDADCANGAVGGTFDAGAGTAGADLVSGTLLDIAASQTRSLYFQVTIN